MPAWLIVLLCVFPGLPLAVFIALNISRFFRLARPSPMPHWMAPLIDNPVRRLFYPTRKIVNELGAEPGMRALEVGPGHGTYTLAVARRLGDAGRLVAVDIQPEIILRLKKRVEREGVKNVEARTADVNHLPFPDGSFDLVYLMMVLGEIPDHLGALREFKRVLKPVGRLALQEWLPDPDYHPAGTLVKWCAEAGLACTAKRGGFFNYTLIFTPAGGN
ncbi:MAG TPA: methyltransferase domain-containing protein [bacterium]|nr:methyltransferase domain-containing protein [bacterium]